jgi:hypothetical protein
MSGTIVVFAIVMVRGCKRAACHGRSRPFVAQRARTPVSRVPTRARREPQLPRSTRVERLSHATTRMRNPILVLLVLVSFNMIACKRDHVLSAPAPAPPRALLGDDDEAPPSVGQGAKKWRDTGVYLDGKPLGMLSFGELPVGLSPIWVKEKHAAPIAPGSHDPGFTWVEERRYRFVDYLKAMGVDLRRLRELHVMGPRLSEVIVVSGAELRGPRGRELLFRFAGLVGGKAIPVVPRAMGNGVKPDKISCVMVYVDRAPPVLVPGEGLQLDGKPVVGVPYFGEPLRGGVRVYQDDKLALVIKRPLLRATRPSAIVGGESRYRLWDLLAAQGVDTARVAEGWLITDERREHELSRAQLEAATFAMGQKQKNEILVGDESLRASAIALHTRALTPGELPAIRPEEEN